MLCIENVIVGVFPIYQSLGLSSTATVLITLSSIYYMFSQDTVLVAFSIFMLHNDF